MSREETKDLSVDERLKKHKPLTNSTQTTDHIARVCVHYELRDEITLSILAKLAYNLMGPTLGDAG